MHLLKGWALIPHVESMIFMLKYYAQFNDVIMIYIMMHGFVSLVVEGDELYTKVDKNPPQYESQGGPLC